MERAEAAAAHTCAGCGQVFPAGRLSCPACQRLVHREQLQELRVEAERLATEGDRHGALVAWRKLHALLPPASNQARAARERIESLTAAVAADPAPAADKPTGMGKLAGLGALGLVLWKIKWLVPFLLTKGKFLLFGLTKMSTLLSMLLSLGVYWTVWGWKFALGLVLSIYVHEIGHVAALRRLGIEATAPMFVPGIGAFIRSKSYPVSPEEDAEVGLAGPLWGLGVAIVAFGAYLVWDAAIFGAIAKVGAWINLFNLLPLGGLDGARGVSAIARRERWVLTALIGAGYFFTGEGLLLLLALTAGGVAMMGRAPETTSPRALFTFATLIIALTLLSHLDLPDVGRL